MKKISAIFIFGAFLSLAIPAGVVFAAQLRPTLIVGKTVSANTLPYANIRSIYLATGYINSDKKVTELLDIFKTSDANGIVIDFKDSNVPDMERMKYLAGLFKGYGVYTIARVVVFQDSHFAEAHPEAAIKTSSGELWWSGKKSWGRYWLDPASPVAQDYTIAVAKKAIDAGFDEVQFDYIRFPTDGDLNDIVYPVFRVSTSTPNKIAALNGFFTKLRSSLNGYKVGVKLGIDIFGDVMTYGKASNIGQDLVSIGTYFDVISPMSYPSHYNCGAFDVQDPTAYPYTVYNSTISAGQRTLKGSNSVIRPWVQDFTMTSIYKCGPLVYYNTARVNEEIKGGRDLGVNGFMLWNAGNNFTKGVFGKKPLGG